ncbi:MAG: C45 family autoproteolytic acyltransferase/hydrolase [Verrucomicrobiota bacterium]|nr:C45 family autoproteolytic acyltransferase/hydrolase [Verrucomicrobiota bacterium]
MRTSIRVSALFVALQLLFAPHLWSAALASSQEACLKKAHRREKNGWIYLHVEGEPSERGFQHGYLLAREIAEGIRRNKVAWEYESGMDWAWLVQKADTLFAGKIDEENTAELDGIVAGLNAAGLHVSRAELIAYNAWIELVAYWWPGEFKKLKEGAIAPPVRQSCSAFVAAGKATRDGGVVLGHNTMAGYHEALPNVILDVVPRQGHRILMQTWPGWIHSGTDFFMTDAGLVGAETTIGGFEAFDPSGIPEFVRMRRATQDADSIDAWCDIMRRGNNGGYANAWLLGDIRSGEIARLELGLKHVAFEKKARWLFRRVQCGRGHQIAALRDQRARNGHSHVQRRAACAMERAYGPVQRACRCRTRQAIRG